MDNAVALVQAYLRLNGYLTVSEHPVIGRHGTGFRIMTDLDILAVRFPNSGDALGGRPDLPEAPVGPDPMRRVCGDRPDMLIGEVKEGRAVLNAAATNPGVVRAALLRFGCCGSHDLEPAVRRLLERGTADLANGHRVTAGRLRNGNAGQGTPSVPRDHARALPRVLEGVREGQLGCRASHRIQGSRVGHAHAPRENPPCRQGGR